MIDKVLNFLQSRALGNAMHTCAMAVAYTSITFTYIHDGVKEGFDVFSMVAYATVMGIFTTGNKILELRFAGKQLTPPAAAPAGGARDPGQPRDQPGPLYI